MKNISIIEIIGLLFLFLGFVLMLMDDFLKENPISVITEKHQIIFWGGMLIWAIGNMSRTKGIGKK